MNLCAPINTLGYGVASVNLLAALAKQRDIALFPIGPAECEPRFLSVVEEALLYADDNRFYGNSCLRISHPFDMALRVGDGAFGGLSFFEADAFTPRELNHLFCLDFVFAPSVWAKDIFIASGIPVHRVKLVRPGVDLAVFNPSVLPMSREQLGEKPSTTIFFTAGKWSLNKGHDFLLEAFNRAFLPEDDVALIMACHNPLSVPGVFDGPAESQRWARSYMMSPMGVAGKIKVVKERLPQQSDLAALMASSDCGLFLSRGEGFNLECAEMLAMGKAVIATDCTAQSDYCRLADAKLVRPDGLESADDGVFLIGTGRWAKLGDGALEQGIQHMRDIHKEKQTAGNILPNAKGIGLFRDCFTWDKCASTIIDELA